LGNHREEQREIVWNLKNHLLKKRGKFDDILYCISCNYFNTTVAAVSMPKSNSDVFTGITGSIATTDTSTDNTAPDPTPIPDPTTDSSSMV